MMKISLSSQLPYKDNHTISQTAIASLGCEIIFHTSSSGLAHRSWTTTI